MDKKVLNQIKSLKNLLRNDGFIIDGVFGSYARGENTPQSDIDILYHLESDFYEKNSGFLGFKKLEEIKNLLSEALEKKVDIAPKNNLSKTAQKYILSEVVYV
ncbi:nucleotidyltransferase family protein [Sulfurimonas sp.]|uniref:nucleotidyltransferase family protein n=1 Tax=Sulfurimonas sp. TaxID=2022749 RepID=UPI003D097149